MMNRTSIELVVLVDGVEFDRRHAQDGTWATDDFACDLRREAQEWNPGAEIEILRVPVEQP